MSGPGTPGTSDVGEPCIHATSEVVPLCAVVMGAPTWHLMLGLLLEMGLWAWRFSPCSPPKSPLRNQFGPVPPLKQLFFFCLLLEGCCPDTWLH